MNELCQERIPFIPSSHLQALDPQRMVVEGMCGSGKSFLAKTLINPEFCKNIAILSSITESHCIALDSDVDSRNFPNKDVLEELLRLPEMQPEIIWKIAILRLFESENSSWMDDALLALKNKNDLYHKLDLLDKKLVQAQKISLVVVDAIDCISNDISLMSKMGAGLLLTLLELRFFKGLRIKAFFREDVLHYSIPLAVDCSKILNNKVVLQWSRTDLYALAFFHLLQQNNSFRKKFEPIFKEGKLNDEDRQKRFWSSIVCDDRGQAATKGQSYPYLFNHLSDALGRVTPSIFCDSLEEAIRGSAERYSIAPYLIHYEAIRMGVRYAHEKHRIEMENKYPWIDPALQFIQPQKETVPIDWITLKAIWLDNNAAVLNDIEAMRGTALIPWSSNASTAAKIELLRSTLEQIGIIKSRMKGNSERIEIPDIYRLAYKIGRKGGISTRKKP